MMNPETKRFEPVVEPRPESTRHWPTFRIGEVVEVGGVKMRVRKFTRKDMILRPLRDDDIDS